MSRFLSSPNLSKVLLGRSPIGLGLTRRSPLHRHPIRNQPISFPYGTQSSQNSSGKSGAAWALGLMGVGVGSLGFYLWNTGKLDSNSKGNKTIYESIFGKKEALPPSLDYQKVYNVIAEKIIESNPDYDDGSYAPILVRLAWHASGTYDKKSNTGGSHGSTMRHSLESNHGVSEA